MQVIIKQTFTDKEQNSDSLLVTPYSFGKVLDWTDKVVTGDKYYVDKAVSLGAKRQAKTKK